MIKHDLNVLFQRLRFYHEVVKWLEYDENLAKASSITLVVQVNGKVRDKIEVDESLSEDEMKEIALSSEKVKEFTAGKTVVKTIVVPKKLVNIVVK